MPRRTSPGPPTSTSTRPSPVLPGCAAGIRCPTRTCSRRPCARCGVGDDDEVVVYDQATSLAAGRAWWVLRWAAHPQVRVLDGGLDAWRRAGLPVTTEVPSPATRRHGRAPRLRAGARRRGRGRDGATGVLLDARAPERFRGEAEPIDRVAGRVPGSVNLPMTDLLAPDGSFLPADEVRRRAAAAGVHRDTPVGTSCGSGVTAAQLALALHTAGIDAIPYVGSWSEWIEDPTRPVATGVQSV